MNYFLSIFSEESGFQNQKVKYVVLSVVILFFVPERMDHYRMARRVLMAEVSGGRVRGRPRLG